MNEKQSYTGIQSLRFFAALLVVLSHATGMYAERMLGLSGENYWKAGMAGVDIFFVISGFVMYVSGARLRFAPGGWMIFLVKRFIRIVPMYWCATALKIALVIAFPAYVLNSPLDIGYLISSFLFIPYFDESGRMVLPMLKVGWTLNYEMFFYIIFALSLFWSLSALRFSALVLGGVSLLNAMAIPGFDLANGFFNPLVLEFLMGMLIARYLQRPNCFGVAQWFVIVAVSFAIVLYFQNIGIWWRWLFWGVPAAFIVAATVMAERSLSANGFGVFMPLGNSSYSLYLFHTFVVPTVGVLMVRFGIINELSAIIVSVTLSILAAYLVFYFIERPVTIKLNAIANFRS